MILKAFRAKSNQKFVEKLLRARTATVNQKKIQTVGVLVHLDEFADTERFMNFFSGNQIRQNRVKVVGYAAEENQREKMWDTNFNEKDFGWKGKIKNSDLQEFVDTSFDLLISYYRDDLLELKMITAQSKANFKVGISQFDDRLYDLIIDVGPKEFDLFASELKKYLQVLNKI